MYMNQSFHTGIDVLIAQVIFVLLSVFFSILHLDPPSHTIILYIMLCGMSPFFILLYLCMCVCF